MRRTTWIRGLILGVLGLAVVGVGLRPTLEGSQQTELAATSMGGAFGGPARLDEAPPPVVHVVAPKMSLEATRVWLKLQEPLAMNFPNDTPLEDVKKYIEAATQEPKGAFPSGIPIYVDPQGLQNADKTMASTVSINLQGMPLATTLKLVLKQLSLTYYIQKDGLLVITSHDDEEATEVSTRILEELEALRTEVQALRNEVRVGRGPERAEPAKAAAGK